MMAERKRKVKWSLNPRGKDWSQNSNKFGQKILEKMGWSEGKGLGANEDGVTSHIRVAFKNDTQGMGYKERDDQWTDNQSDFTKLLNDLAETYGVNNANNGTEKKLESLELKSKTSRARVHYHKFTRGKDLSRYSEKDLANIFGKKTLDEVGTSNKEDAKKENDEENQVDKSFGVETHNGGNMLDYFKNKLPNFKNTNSTKSKIDKEDCDSDFERPSFGLGFSQKKEEYNDEKEEQPKNMRKNMSNGKSQPQDNFRKTCFGLGYDRYNDDETKPKSKFTSFVKATDTNEKKEPLKYGISKIVKQNDSENCESSNCEKQKSGLGFNASSIGRIQSSFMSFVKGSVQNNGTEDEVNVVKKKKDKKRKKSNDDSLNDDVTNNKRIKLHTDENNQGLLNISNTEQITKNIDEVIIKNESKNKKKKNKEQNSGAPIEENAINSSPKKKSKKNKNKATFVSFLEESNSLEDTGEENAKNKSIEQSSEDIERLAKNGNVEDSEKISKKKKNKNGATGEIVDTQKQSNVTEDVSSKKGKKRKSDSELDVAFTPMKKKFKNFEDLHVLQDEEKIIETPKKIKKNKKSKQEGQNDEEQGIKNPAFDPLHNGVVVQKKQLDPIEEETENISQNPDVKKDATGSASTESKSNKNCGVENGDVSSIKSEKKNKKKKPKNTDNSQVEENSVEDKSQKKSKKKKLSSVEGIDNLGAEDSLVINISQSETVEDVSELNKSEKKKKKKPKTVEGIVNLGLEDVSMRNESSQSFDSSTVSQSKEKKSKKNKKNLGIDNSAFNDNVESNGSVKSNEVEENGKKHNEVNPSPIKEKKKKKQKKVDEIGKELDNPCFSCNDSMDNSTVTPNKYEVKRSKKNENLGIVNPALDLTSPPPATDKHEPIIEELPKLDDNLLLNVVCTPIIKKENNKKPLRRKSVRFSDANQSIFINAMDSPADLKKNGGVDNAAFDQFGNRMEENIGILSKQLDDYQAEVENDLNEAKMQLVVGEISDPDGENEILPNGDVMLRLKYAKFGRMPHWMKKKDDTSAKTSYRHLIKGDITLGFKNTNMHLIKGYNTNLKAGT